MSEGEAENFQAENSEAFQIMNQHTEMLRVNLKQAKYNLNYMLSEGADAESISQIEAHIDAINSLLEGILNSTRQTALDRLQTAAKKDMDHQQYLAAYNLYEKGHVRRALSKFKVLAQTTDNVAIKTDAQKSIELIEGFDWGENVPE